MSKTILHIDASVSLNESKSRAASARLVEASGADTILRRDLALTPVPHIDHHWVTAGMIPVSGRSEFDHAKLSLSNELIAEIEAADEIVIGMPIYDFTVPAQIKSWVDLIARPGVSFKYTEKGPIGLLRDKPVKVVVASGGTPIGAQHDHATPYMRFILGFVGITDVTFIEAADILEQTALAA